MAETPPTKIVVRGVNWLGDAVMSTPALLRLRERFPKSVITIVTTEKLAPLYEHHPAVSSILVIQPGDGLLAVAGKIRSLRADLALVLPNSPRTSLECWLAGVPKRVGYKRSWRSWFLTDAVAERQGERSMRKRSLREIQRLLANPAVGSPPLPADSHHIHQYLHLVGSVGASVQPLAPSIKVTPAEKRSCEVNWRLTQDGDAVARRWIGINAGAEYGPAKRWPVERFAETVRRIGSMPSIGIMIFGGPGDVETASMIENAMRPSGAGGRVIEFRNTAGKTNLRELAGLLASCAVVLTNDTGPMHLAAAVGTPVVAMFGSTSPALTAPGLPGENSHRILSTNTPCSPCFLKTCPIDLRCLLGISVEAAVNAVADRLK